MKIFVLNCGSSSVKCSLFDFQQLPTEFVPPLWETQQKGIEEALKRIESLDVIGHRIVHGGKKYQKSTLITSGVKKEIEQLEPLAPLHNREDLQGIAILEKQFPKVPQVAVFDTAFHRTMPLTAKLYPGPYAWYEQGIERFGFHGISYQYCTKRASRLLGKLPQRMVICHLGSGASLCAIFNGKSVDTTMGFTPLEGLMMDTRSGSVDPGILLYLLRQGKTVEALSQELNAGSGLLGISGISGEMREVLQQAPSQKRAQLALDLYVHRLVLAIGAMIASLGGIDLLVFTGGIGEKAARVRQLCCQKLAFLGIALASEDAAAGDRLLTKKSSSVPVLLIHTQEAFEIACECFIYCTDSR